MKQICKGALMKYLAKHQIRKEMNGKIASIWLNILVNAFVEGICYQQS